MPIRTLNSQHDFFRRIFVLSAYLVIALGLAISPQSLATSVGSSSDQVKETAPIHYTHFAAGFEITVPGGWSLEVNATGLEAEQGDALLAIDLLPYKQGMTAEILAIATGNDTIQGKKISSPATGLRASIKEKEYSAEVAVLKSPVGIYLVSYEQTGTTNPADTSTFERFFNSFKLLGSQPIDYEQRGMEYVNLGPVEVSLPPGSLTKQPGSLIWKSTAGGILSAEIVSKEKNDKLTVLIEGWEAVMLGRETGLSERTSLNELHIDGRPTVRSKYSGGDMSAAVIVTEIDPRKALVLTLVTKPSSFNSHRQLLDAACFSTVLSGGEEISLDVDDKPGSKLLSKGSSSAPRSTSISNSTSTGLSKLDRKLYEQLRSKDPDEVRYAAKFLYRGRYQSKSLLDTAAEVLKTGYLSEQNNTHIDAMAWICKALGASGKKKYQSLLKQVASKAPSRKLQGYADKAARRL